MIVVLWGNATHLQQSSFEGGKFFAALGRTVVVNCKEEDVLLTGASVGCHFLAYAQTALPFKLR